MNDHELNRRIAGNLRSDRWPVSRVSQEHGVSEERVRQVAAEEGIDLNAAPPVVGLRRAAKAPRKDIDG